jgi:hypothetical protein
MLRRKLVDTPLFPLFVVLQILPETWPRVRRSTNSRPMSNDVSAWSGPVADDDHAKMERLMRAIDETRARQT